MAAPSGASAVALAVGGAGIVRPASSFKPASSSGPVGSRTCSRDRRVTRVCCCRTHTVAEFKIQADQGTRAAAQRQ